MTKRLIIIYIFTVLPVGVNPLWVSKSSSAPIVKIISTPLVMERHKVFRLHQFIVLYARVKPETFHVKSKVVS